MGVCISVCLQSTFSAHCCACVRNVVVSGLRIKSLRRVHTMNTLCIGYTLFGFTSTAVDIELTFSQLISIGGLSDKRKCSLVA